MNQQTHPTDDNIMISMLKELGDIVSNILESDKAGQHPAGRCPASLPLGQRHRRIRT